MIPITQADVEKALERPLLDDDPDEVSLLAGRVEKASDLVEGYIGITYTVPPEVVPGVVTRVTAAVVARMYRIGDKKVPDFQDSVSQGMGPFNVNTRFNADATSGDPWLTKKDKAALRPVYSGFRSMSQRSERGWDCEWDC